MRVLMGIIEFECIYLHNLADSKFCMSGMSETYEIVCILLSSGSNVKYIYVDLFVKNRQQLIVNN